MTAEPLIETIAQAAAREAARGLPPVQAWNPPFCGDIDMRIARDGTWFYLGTPIGRPAMVRLFSTILRRDAERYVLVTPVEMVGIVVEDAPFIAVEMRVETGVLAFRTNVGDWTRAGPEHPMRFERGAAEGVKPYVHVRDGLWALVTRALFYDLVAAGETQGLDGQDWFGVTSGGVFFPMSLAAEMDGL